MKAMKLVLAGAVLLAAQVVSAEMLYWMVGESNAIEFNYAVVYAVDANGRIALPDNGEGGEIYGNEDLSPTRTTGPILTAFGDSFDWSGYSYYVELLAWDGENESSVGVSEWATYDSLVARGAIIPSDMAIPVTAHPWDPTFNVPEPSSALLMLVGLAIAALRRRSASAPVNSAPW